MKQVPCNRGPPAAVVLDASPKKTKNFRAVEGHVHEVLEAVFTGRVSVFDFRRAGIGQVEKTFGGDGERGRAGHGVSRRRSGRKVDAGVAVFFVLVSMVAFENEREAFVAKATRRGEVVDVPAPLS